jgi:thymidylate synthase (FAD)
LQREGNAIYLYDDEIGKVELVQTIGNDLSVVNAARVSFGVEKEELDDRDKKLINYLVKHKHTSTLEHCFMTFKFVVPLYVRSQHHRHRTWSYNEISRRYTSVDMQFYEPKTFRTQHETNRQASNEDRINPDLSMYKNGPLPVPANLASDAITWHNRRSLDLYNKLIENGVCREQARGVLPQNLYTTYIGSVNLNNLLKFIALRDHEGAQVEIQQVAKACLTFAQEHFPHTVAAYRENRQGH